jgi:Co/Zn/Cd efflux system component
MEAFDRLYSYYDGTMEPIDGKMMSAVAFFGICVNLTIALVFADEHGSGFSFHDHSGHDHSHGHAHG